MNPKLPNQNQSSPNTIQSPISIALNNETFFHPKHCIHTEFSTSHPTLFNKLLWQSRLLTFKGHRSINTIQSKLDNIADWFVSKLSSTTLPLSQSQQLHRSLTSFQNRNGIYGLYTLTLDGIYYFIIKLLSYCPQFIRNKIDIIYPFVKEQPLWQYYSFALYHAPKVLFLSTFINYILPLILEGLPWYISPRILSRTIRNQRTLLHNSLLHPTQLSSSSTTTNTPQQQHGIFPAHLLIPNAPPPQSTLSSTLSPNLITPPSLITYTLTTIWQSIINHSLSNLRLYVDLLSHSVVQQLVLYTLLTRYEIPNNGNGSSYSQLNDPISVGSFYIATHHANMLIPNIFRTIYTIYQNSIDLYQKHFTFTQFPFILLLRPLLLAFITESISLLRSYIIPPIILSSNVNSETFINSVSSSMNEIKSMNVQYRQYSILNRITRQESIISYGPITICDKVLHSIQYTGLLDDISESIVSNLLFNDQLQNNNNHNNDHNNHATIPLQDTNLSLQPINNNSSIINNNINTQTNNDFNIITNLKSIFQSIIPTQFLFGNNLQSQNYLIITREIRWVVVNIRRVYDDILSVLGFMINRPPLPLQEVNTTWNQFFQQITNHSELYQLSISTLSDPSIIISITQNDNQQYLDQIIPPQQHNNNTTKQPQLTTSTLTKSTPIISTSPQNILSTTSLTQNLSTFNFYTSFDQITINSIIYTYPNPSTTSRSISQMDSTLVYNHIANWLTSLFFSSSLSLPSSPITTPQSSSSIHIYSLPSNTTELTQLENNQHLNEYQINTLHNHQIYKKTPALFITPSNQHNIQLSNLQQPQQQQRQFTFNRGKFYVCCGVNTSGKSTLAQVLSRFLMISEQSLPTDCIDVSIHLSILQHQQLQQQFNHSHNPTFNKININNIAHTLIPLQHYRRHILYLRQKPYIFNATLIDNITGYDHTYIPPMTSSSSSPPPTTTATIPLSSTLLSPLLSPQNEQLQSQSKLYQKQDRIQSLMLHSLDYYHGSIKSFLHQKIPCVCTCDCGLISCSSNNHQLSKQQQQQQQQQDDHQLQHNSCHLNLKWIIWAMYMSGLYNSSGDVDAEVLKQQEQQNQFQLQTELELQQRSQFFQSTTTPNRPWLGQFTNSNNNNKSNDEQPTFINRVLNQTIGFNLTSIKNMCSSSTTQASSSTPLHSSDTTNINPNNNITTISLSNCSCQCQCDECLLQLYYSEQNEDENNVEAISTPITPLPGISTPQLLPVPTDPQQLWDSINQIQPIPQEDFITLNCNQLFEKLSTLHPLLSFPMSQTITTTTTTASTPSDSTPLSTTTITTMKPLLPPDSLLNMFITNNGGNISGGFAQSIALARMFIRIHSQYIILDESLSMMDYNKFLIVFPRIIAFSKALNATIIIISHHLRPIVQHSDFIVFMDAGQIICFDKDEDIDHPLYRTLVDS